MTYETNIEIDPEKPFLFNGVCFDPQRGAGATGMTDNVNYMGMVVFARPEDFLRLATYLPEDHVRATRSDMTRLLKGGKFCVAPPALGIEWREDAWHVVGHEGRHRTMALKSLGFHQIPIYLKPLGIRARHLTDDMIKQLRREMFSENRRWVGGFDAKYFIINKRFGTFFYDESIRRQIQKFLQNLVPVTTQPVEDDYYYSVVEDEE